MPVFRHSAILPALSNVINEVKLADLVWSASSGGTFAASASEALWLSCLHSRHETLPTRAGYLQVHQNPGGCHSETAQLR